MAQRKTKKKTTKKKNTRRRRKKSFWSKTKQFLADKKINVIGLLFISIAILAVFNLGAAGTLFANAFRLLVGDAYQLLAVLIGIFGGFLLLGFRLPKFDYHYWIGCGVAFLGWILNLSVSLSNSLNQHVDFIAMTMRTLTHDITNGLATSNVGGGLIGATLLQGLSYLFSLAAASVLAIILMVLGVLIFLNIPIIKWARMACAGLFSEFSGAFHNLSTRFGQYHEAKKEERAAKEAQENSKKKEALEEAEKDAFNQQIGSSKKEPAPAPISFSNQMDESNDKPQEDEEDDSDTAAKPMPNHADGNYQLPSVKLLTKIPKVNKGNETSEISRKAQVLTKTLDSFNVKATVEHVSQGPSFTEYELKPASGVKVSKIVNLSNDIALALAAKDIRIEAPIPGKSLIGVEVPNTTMQTVSFRDVFEHQRTGRNNPLSVPLGEDVNGNVVSGNITQMPHLLIAGSTGSGKSVAINAILTSILLKAKPEDVKLMLIDPKKVELGVYNGIPHLLSPVVAQPKKAARALHKVVDEMEKRYELFAKSGQRNLKGYNQFVIEHNKTSQDKLPKLPYIVVVVDELADLMMTVSNEVESAIVRLAQMGRAAGVHMILATQRPSVDVITGLIKANVPSRIAFAVSSGIDSRTIIDTNGAEKLLGKGDMLYLPIDKNIPTRIQGSFISDRDVENVVNFIKKESEPDYQEEMQVSDEEIQEEEQSQDEDPLFKEAVEFVAREQKASTSMIQRQFRIGYNRAARMIDDMQNRGYVGPSRGSKPREVFKQTEQLHPDDSQKD